MGLKPGISSLEKKTALSWTRTQYLQHIKITANHYVNPLPNRLSTTSILA